MPEPSRCPRCDAPIEAAQADKGGCPACLLELALDSAGSIEPVSAADVSAHEVLAAGSEVGAYRIVRQLGEGGMGVVYLAEQSRPLQRKVALKVIKHGMDTRAVVKRFELERQTLAIMDHPAIARVFEAGATPSGRPYFVMEYIEGEAITDYADRRRLTTFERLELFREVCEGLQHAHQRGVIHRDIKPSNVLVAERDGKPAPKIIDFGVAKATQRNAFEFSQLTALGALLGTPEYMSPEQADLAPLDVDTRTDVYSLGVMLYELLTGALPFDVRQLRKAAFDEVRRQIREVRPSKPSTRLSELGARASELAASRRTDPSTLSRRLAGDLDLITMKALEKERTRRYGSPAELAADIRRHLDDEPVLARPPSAGYLLRKLIARHRLVSALVALLLVTLVGFSVWMSVLYRRAVAAEAGAAREAAVAQRVSEFMVGVFEVSSPDEARGNAVTARELLDVAAKKIDDELVDQPEVRATMMDTMGRVYLSLGLLEPATELTQQALERRESLLGGDAPEVASSLTHLSHVQIGLGDYDAAEASARRALEILDGTDCGPLERVEALEALQVVHWRRREHAEALAAAEQVLALREAVLGPDHYQVSFSLNHLGNIYLAMGDDARAESVLLRSLEMRLAAKGPDHPDVGKVSNNLAEAYRRMGRFEEAEKMFLRVQEIEALHYEPDHPTLAFAFNNLGLVYKRWKRYDDAIAQYRQALAIREGGLPENHPMIAWTLDNLGMAYLRKGDLEAAGEAFTRALRIAKIAVGVEHPDTAILLANLGLLRNEQRRFDEAEALLRESLAINEKAFGRQHREVANNLHNLGDTYEDRGDLTRAREHFREAAEILDATIGPAHPDAVDTRQRYEKLADPE